MTKQYLSIRETSEIYGLGRTAIYELIGCKALKAIKAGSKTLISTETIEAYMASLPAAKVAAPRHRVA